MGRTWRPVLLASAASTLATGAAHAQDAGAEGVQEIIVTAQKRQEPLSRVPASITALDGDSLEAQGYSNLEDFAALVPGLQVQGGGQGAVTLALRGINTGREPSQLVGVLVDGVPYGSSGTFAFAGLSQLDASAYDLERIEVLRGPQGTLYGAGAFGGLLSYVYKAPDLDDTGARAEGEINATARGGTSYALRGAANLVLSRDVAAVRISATHEDQAGWADNLTLDRRDANASRLTNVRAAFLLQPGDRFSARINAVHQKLDRDDADVVLYSLATGRPSTAGLQQNRPIAEPTELAFDQVSLVIDNDFGFATLTSVSSYAETDLSATQDFSQSALRLGLGAIPGVGPLIGSIGYSVDVRVEKFVQELRLASPDDAPFRWLVGGFFTRETGDNRQRADVNLPTGAPLEPLSPALTVRLDSRFKEYAAFANAEYDLTERLQVSGGLRYSRNDQTFLQTNGGPVFAPGGVVGGTSEEDRVDYAATLRLQVGADDYLYARAASGYRAGGPNVALPGAPSSFGADSINNYEIGYKARFLGGRGTLDIAAFHIDWSDVQLTAVIGGLGARINGGDASSRGVEAAASFSLTPGFTLGASAAFTDAQLEDDALPAGGVAGERLPNTPRFSGALQADYRFAINGQIEGVLGGSVRYTGARTSGFAADPGTPQFRLDDYAVADLRAGIVADRFRVTAFVRNLFDARGQIAADTARFLLSGEAQVTIARPRTIGLSLATDF